MFTIGGIGFTAPVLLVGLITLPVLWYLLRAVPPAPIRRRFPGVALLLGLTDDDVESDKTPWWLLALRTLAIGAVIIGFSGPVLNPKIERDGSGPLLVVIDGTWADARDWPRRMERLEDLLAEASRADRTAAIVTLTELPPDGPSFQAADTWRQRVAALRPNPWVPQADAISDWAETLDVGAEVFWMADGLDHPWRTDLLRTFESIGPVTVFQSPRPILGLRPPVYDDGVIGLTVVRADPAGDAKATITARGPDPAGTPRSLARADIVFAPGEAEAMVELALPSELRNRVTRFQLDGIRSAAAVTLTDDSLRRREVALVAGQDDREGLQLLSPTHYLEQALAPTADLIDGTLSDILLANPDVIVLADVATLTAAEATDMLTWVSDGGLLLRFAGPRLAASDISREKEDPLMPVRLRAGGRNVGGAMSWGEPKSLRAFNADSPFFGVPVPDEVRVSAQVMAQPDPTLAERVIASLSDGTPLVTRKREGAGQIVLFHVTANAEWSSLPLSVLFVQMLERLAVSTRPADPTAEDLAGTVWVPDEVLTAFGGIEVSETLAGVPGEVLAEGFVGPELQPGLYAGEDRRIAVNVIKTDSDLSLATWPERIATEGLTVTPERALKGLLLMTALVALMADILASLWLSGRLIGPRVTAAVTALAALSLFGDPVVAQSAEESFGIDATAEVVLAYVVTGDAAVDQTARAGLRGLSDVLFRRTSIEPAAPVAVDLEMNELSFFPLLYWPITASQPLPSSEAYAKLNRYLRSGGLILFDTRDSNIASFGEASENGRKLRQLAASLDIPPLEPIPPDHVLTRAFYLLQDYPGRHASRDVWVEAAPPDAEQVEGMPFRNLNDNVTPVVIGGNDWAAAWATDTNGARMFPVGRGYAGERQREIAFRFGVNLVMHVLTGNYKSDQVHVPALLDRLGQ